MAKTTKTLIVLVEKEFETLDTSDEYYVDPDINTVQKWLEERGMVMIDKDEIRDIDCNGELAKLLREHGIGLYYRCSYL